MSGSPAWAFSADSDSLERRGSERDTVTKKAEYAAGGVPEYYILHREPERQAFFTP
ncbi:hypothetical protein [Candidatus Thiodictyon syntrophicum]|uniref:hypothetical protein n=1 Tax=Candidatus Thiodictyon syntrophicum TaxID=1166950 RepID=UPI0015620E37|nr:hypothetical protein [Candidatus Thiodictyon syntrophicum]